MRGSARGGVHADTGFFIPSPPFEGARAGQEATREEVSPAALTQDVEQAAREGAHGGGARGSARGGVHVHADIGVFSPPRASEDARAARAAMREELSPAALMQEVARAAQEGAHGGRVGAEWSKTGAARVRAQGVGAVWTRALGVRAESDIFFELDQLRRSSGELLTVHPAPNSLQVVTHQDCSTNTPQADLILNMLLNINDECRKVIIIKLVSNIEICRSIEDVLSSLPIIQATFNKTLVNWEDCTPPYAVDKRAFRNHTRGRNKGLPCNPDPNVRTVGERMATSRAKTKVVNSLRSVGTLEQQRLILLRLLSDPSIRDILSPSSIGINMNEIKLGQQLLRCARKLIRRSKNSPDNNGG